MYRKEEGRKKSYHEVTNIKVEINEIEEIKAGKKWKIKIERQNRNASKCNGTKIQENEKRKSKEKKPNELNHLFKNGQEWLI